MDGSVLLLKLFRPEKEYPQCRRTSREAGWEFAEISAARGFSLFLTGRDESRLQLFKKEHEEAVTITTAVADLSAPNGVEEVLDAIKRGGASIDILVNYAGLGDRRAFVEAELDKQRAMIPVNITALVSLTHGLLPAMVGRRAGRILNVASTAGFFPVPLCRSTTRARHS